VGDRTNLPFLAGTRRLSLELFAGAQQLSLELFLETRRYRVLPLDARLGPLLGSGCGTLGFVRARTIKTFASSHEASNFNTSDCAKDALVKSRSTREGRIRLTNREIQTALLPAPFAYSGEKRLSVAGVGNSPGRRMAGARISFDPPQQASARARCEKVETGFSP
jgi:hypothetical protein